MKDLKEKINAMTADVDSLNAQEGYRGTSYAVSYTHLDVYKRQEQGTL